jgi:hypothetical protein
MAVAVGGLGAPLTATASSHREAPLISQDPTADNTDVYAYTHGSNVVLVANYIGLEQPASGPNFHRFGDDVLYQIHVDNVGDGQSHLDFNFRFTTQNLKDPLGNDTFLYNFGAIHRVSSNPSVPGVNPYSGWLRPQSYSVTAVNRDRQGDEEEEDSSNVAWSQPGLYTSPDAVGLTSTGKPSCSNPNKSLCYNNDLTNGAVYNVGPRSAVKVYAGQRDDPFFANLGGIFDFLTITGQKTGAEDYLDGLNVHSIVMEMPASMLTRGNDPVVGVWATSSRRAVTVLHSNGSKSESGRWVQVSRLGNPLVNEVIIGQSQKDLFNASKPSSDSQFEGRFTSPLLAKYINALFGDSAPTTGRNDLVKVLLQGDPALSNKPAGGSVEADELRLNTTTASGWPNGRTLTDDVVDTAIEAVDGLTCGLATPPCTPGTLTGAGDGVAADADHRGGPMATFPYLNDPNQPDD